MSIRAFEFFGLQLCIALLGVAVVAGCAGGGSKPPPDSGVSDGGPADSGSSDAGPGDSGSTDAGADSGMVDSGFPDAGSSDAGASDGGQSDGGATDAGSDAGIDAGIDGGVCWLSPVMLSTSSSSLAGSATAVMPAFAVDGLGNAFAAWSYDYYPSGAEDLWVSQYGSAGWSTALQLVADAGTIWSNKMVANASGQAAFVYQEHSPVDGGYYIKVFHYAPGGGWTGPNLASALPWTTSQTTWGAWMGLDDQDRAVAVWLQQSQQAGNYAVYLATSPGGGTGWSAPVEIDDAGAYGPSNLSMAMNGQGTALVSWTAGGSPSPTWAALFFTDGGSQTSIISDPAATAVDTSSAINGSGQAIVTWLQNNGGNNDLYAAQYLDGGWTSPVQVNYPDAGHVETAMAAIEGNGVAEAVWQALTSPSYSVLTSRCVDGGWAPAVLVDQGSFSAQPSMPVLANNGAGVGMTAWAQSVVMGSEWDTGFNFTSPATMAGPGYYAGSAAPLVGVTPGGQRFVVFLGTAPASSNPNVFAVHCP